MRLHSEVQTKIKNFSAPEFDKTYDPIVTQSKGMLKTPELVNDSSSLHRLISKTKYSLK